jgi:D-amino-acid dehydrogenase
MTPGVPDRPADAIVLGAGIVGVTTAHALAGRGLAVCLVDRDKGPARGASFANGAQLSYAYADALAAPGLLRKLPALALGLDPLFRLKPGFDPALYGWLLSFLRNMTATRFARNTLDVLELALESQQAMDALLRAHPIAFDHAVPGKMHLHYSQASLDAAARTMALKQQRGVEQEILPAAAAIALEPALAQVEGLAGVVHSPRDAVGDAHRFAEGLLALCRERGGVAARFDFAVERIERRSDGEGFVLHAADGGIVAGRRLVLCAGAQGARIGRTLGLRLPVQPMKGYSFTARPGLDAPRISLTDTKRKLVFCRLGASIRVAGLAELGARSTVVAPDRSALLRRLAREAMPGAIDPDSIGEEWAGLRPMTPYCGPIIRWVDPALAINIGHGMLGWTLALGSARRLADGMPGHGH